MSLLPASVRIWSPQLPPQEQIHIFWRKRVQILSTDRARAARRFSADFMKTGSVEEEGEELFFWTLGS